MTQESNNQKLYILVRNDIPVPDQAVQACHAAEMWAKFDQGDFRDGATVLLSISGTAIGIWQRKLAQKCLSHCHFQEPDLGNIVTVIACHTDTNIFSGLPLWTGKSKEDQAY